MPDISAISLRHQLATFLRIGSVPNQVASATQARIKRDGYDEVRIDYSAEPGERIPAFLLLPTQDKPLAAVLIQHQHASEWHWGKSEVVGHAGNPLQAFGPALARRGVIVLAPDSICFEDRRTHLQGTAPGEGETDWFHHYNAMAYRLVRGDMLMRKVLNDSMVALSVLAGLKETRGLKLGTLGHSYGGNTVLFHAAIDERISFACSSGAACTYRRKLASNTGIEMAEVIPGFAAQWDIEDLVRAMAPRPLLLVSGCKDPYSADADEIERLARPAYAEHGKAEALAHQRDEGAHAMTPERFEFIVEWMTRQAAS